MLNIGKRDTILAAWAEYHRGCGFTNRVVYVLISREDHSLDLIGLQSDECSAEIDTLCGVSAEVNGAMIRAVTRLRRKER